MPQQHMVIPHYLGSREINHENKVQNGPKEIKRLDSFSPRSSSQDIPLLLPQEADGMGVALDDSRSKGLDPTSDHHIQPRRNSGSFSLSFLKSKAESLLPDMQMKGFVDDHDFLDFKTKVSSGVVEESVTKMSDEEWWETQERGNQLPSIDENEQVGPRTSCRCQVVCWLLCFVDLFTPILASILICTRIFKFRVHICFVSLHIAHLYNCEVIFCRDDPYMFVYLYACVLYRYLGVCVNGQLALVK